MRVIAGTARSMPLKAPKGIDTRPTTDRIKETLFNILQNDVPGSVFVDLFSGSWAIGIEAISRGAKKVYFVENAKEAISCIEQNLSFTKFTDKAILYKTDAVAAVTALTEPIDIIFMDPPYETEAEKRVLSALVHQKAVTNDTLIIVEASLKTAFDYVSDIGFEVIREKCYKTNKHVFIKRS